MKTKTFDCVELQHRGGEKLRKRLEGMTFDEQVEFWRKESEALKQLQAEVRKQS